jgi:hypothetical protein
MRGPAEQQNDRSRDLGQATGREPESASFAVARVGGGQGRWSTLIAAGFAAVLVGMVGIAIGSRGPGTEPAIPPVAFVSPGPSTVPTATPGTTEAGPRQSPGPLLTSDPDAGQIHLLARRQPDAVYVHGDVYVVDLTWVFVSLQDATGRVASWASVSVPGAAGAATGSGPTLRFDVELAVPAGFSGPLSIGANAYDSTARVIGSTQLIVSAEDAP